MRSGGGVKPKGSGVVVYVDDIVGGCLNELVFFTGQASQLRQRTSRVGDFDVKPLRSKEALLPGDVE